MVFIRKKVQQTINKIFFPTTCHQAHALKQESRNSEVHSCTSSEVEIFMNGGDDGAVDPWDLISGEAEKEKNQVAENGNFNFDQIVIQVGRAADKLY